MEIPTGLIVIIVIYGVLYFFDSFFKSCAHYPYIQFLKGTGLELKPLQVRWQTTAFNRLMVRWGVKFLRFLNIWFKLGVYASLALLPVSIVILVVSLSHDLFPTTSKQTATIEPAIPYMNVPSSEIPYYSLSLLLCSIVHEMGHALAAVTEDVHINSFGTNIFFVLPVAYVSLSTEKLFSLTKPKVLKILCAGIWHNLVLAFVCYLIYLSLPTLLSPFFMTGKGVLIREMAKNSPVSGVKGFSVGDTITKINDCDILDDYSWYNCLQKSQNLTTSFCLNSDLVHELEESAPVKHEQGVIDCCGKGKPKNLCFEYLDNNNGVLELPPYACLPARDVLVSTADFCMASPHVCPENSYCFQPVLQNSTNLFKIERFEMADVIFIGLPSDMSNFISVSPYIPKYFFKSSLLPDMITNLLSYMIIFSLGLGIINVLPCAFMDGQYILNTLVPLVLRSSINEERTRVISCVITILTTVFLVAHLLYVTVTKFLI